MELETFSYQRDSGWSANPLPGTDSDSTLVLVFGAPEFAKAAGPLRELAERYPTSHIIGCSTAGEIFDATLNDNSLSVAVAHFERTRIATAGAPVAASADSFEAGLLIARQLDGADLRGVLVLSEGLHVNGSELVRGMNAVLASSVVVTGGLAADGDRFQQTWVLTGGKPSDSLVCAVGLYGENVRIGHGSKGGWDIFGPERHITRSEGNVLFELDGKPALGLYKEYLGELASGLPATGLLFPLALRTEGQVGPVRTILAVDEAAQSLSFAGDVPEGALAQLMRANFDRLIDGAYQAGRLTVAGQETGSGPTLAVAISCVGRRLVLRERTEEEIEATLDVLPLGTRQIGYYSYGEISPHSNGQCDLHNQTMTLTTIAEV